MRPGGAFSDFNEGHIDFPPTFKYDVLKTIKNKPPGRGRSLIHRKKWKNKETGRFFTPGNGLAEAEENDSADDSDDSDDADTADEDSVSTSTWTSVHSSRLADSEGLGMGQGVSMESSQTSASLCLQPPPQRVKSKKMALIPSAGDSPQTPRPPRRPVAFDVSTPLAHSTSSADTSSLASPSLGSTIPHSQSASDLHHSTSRSTPVLHRAASSKGRSLHHRGEDEPGRATHERAPSVPKTDKGMYDTSSKQRVPSW